VDFHAYFQPPRFLAHLRRRKDYPRIEAVNGGEAVFTAPGAGRPIRPEQLDLDRRVELMDEAGVDTQVLRLQNVGGIDSFPVDEAAEIARMVNEELAAIAARHPGRFIPFAAVPLRSPHRAAEEARHAVRDCGHRGVGVSCHLDGVGLDDPAYTGFLREVQDLGVPLLVLPNHPPLLAAALAPYGWLAGAFGFQVDLTWSALRLLASGVVDREVPRLTVIVANLGGVLGAITERLDQYWERVHSGSATLAVRPSLALRRFHYETASAHPQAVALAASIVGADRLVFGSDYPSFSLDRGVRNVAESRLSREDVEMILAGNASRVLARASSDADTTIAQET
jgi:predicted TIM-barrel fold metal-dependent hydrolase